MYIRPAYGGRNRMSEILELFIRRMQRNPPPEVARWVWDSPSRSCHPRGGRGFRREGDGWTSTGGWPGSCPITASRSFMFTHQSGGHMGRVMGGKHRVAAGMHVTATWYGVTETDSRWRGKLR